MQPHTDHKSHSSVSLKAYIVGFVLSIILTVLPYLVVTHGTFSPTMMMISVVIFAVIQLLVQLIFFLHLGLQPEQRSELMAFVFTVIIIAILVVGSIWIMYNLRINMMPH